MLRLYRHCRLHWLVLLRGSRSILLLPAQSLSGSFRLCRLAGPRRPLLWSRLQEQRIGQKHWRQPLTSIMGAASQTIQANSLLCEPTNDPIHHTMTRAIAKAGQVKSDLGTIVGGGDRGEERPTIRILQHEVDSPLPNFSTIVLLLAKPCALRHCHDRLRDCARIRLGEGRSGLIQHRPEGR